MAAVADGIPPVVTLTTPPEGASYNQGSSVAADYACADEIGGSGIATCVGDSLVGAVIDTATLGARTFTVIGTDNAGNSTSLVGSYEVTPPLATIAIPSIAADDGYVLESSETSNGGGSRNSTGTGSNAIRIGDATQDRQYKSVLSFDTSGIPDGATIQSVTLRLTRGGTGGTNAFTTHGVANVDIKNGSFNDSPALEIGDFEAPESQQVATFADLGGAGTVYIIDLRGEALVHINKTGKTQLRLYFSLDDNDDNGNDYVGFYSANNSNAARHPTLTVNYLPSTGNPPVADDQAVTMYEGTAVTINLIGNDVDGDPLNFVLLASPAHGSLSGTPPAVTYTPLVGFTGTDSFTFQVNNGPGTLDSNIATVSISIDGVVSVPSIAAEDGYVLESSETSNTGGSLSSTGTGSSAIRIGDATRDRQYKSVLSFDTSSIPDGATIKSVTLRLTGGATSGTNAFTTHDVANVDIKKIGDFSGNPALQNGDFEDAADAQWVASFADQGGSGKVYTIDLSSASALVSKTGKTQLRLYFSLDDNDDNGNDFVGFYSSDNGNAARHPTLTVNY
jgi:hypothetical protein